jgi:Cys/Met metabolism PLP-dependent enzyme
MSNEDRAASGVTDGPVRISVGIEDRRDMLADFERALGSGRSESNSATRSNLLYGMKCGWGVSRDANSAGLLTFHRIERQSSHIHPLATVRPGDAGIVSHIARLTNCDHQVPLQRVWKDARNQRIKKIILVSRSCRRRIRGDERLRGYHRPAHGNRCPLLSTKRNALRSL